MCSAAATTPLWIWRGNLSTTWICRGRSLHGFIQSGVAATALQRISLPATVECLPHFFYSSCPRCTMQRILTAVMVGGLFVSPSYAEEAAASQAGITGQGKYRFRLLYDNKHLPAKAVEVLKSAHGGFAVDRRPGKGEIYFALP